jgi:hypothetical protein
MEHEKAKQSSEPVAPPVAPAAAPAPARATIRLGMPILYESPKKDKDKRRYSSRLKGVQRLEQGVARAAERITHGLAEGTAKYRKAADKSARKKKDGALKDAFKNVAKAGGKTMRIASKAPGDVTKKIKTRELIRVIPRGIFR